MRENEVSAIRAPQCTCNNDDMWIIGKKVKCSLRLRWRIYFTNLCLFLKIYFINKKTTVLELLYKQIEEYLGRIISLYAVDFLLFLTGLSSYFSNKSKT